jgi:1-phosphatidylinositol phosphodiesterase
LFWAPTTQTPFLGLVRNKIVLIQDFSAANIYGLMYASFTVLPHKVFATNWDQYSKWLEVKNFLASANSAGNSHISFWTGHAFSFPYFVASGKSSSGNGDPRLLTGLTTPGFSSYYPDFPRVGCFIGICSIAF